MRSNPAQKKIVLVWLMLIAIGLTSFPSPMLLMSQSSLADSYSVEISWSQILDIFKRKKKRGGSRSESICQIAPERLHEESTVVKVWSLTPLFVWNGDLGKLGRIEVIQRNPQKYTWNTFFKPQNQSIFYQGEPLEPGQEYQWNISSYRDPKHPQINSLIIFRVIGSPERDNIAAELASLETELAKQKASVEIIALHRAKYFAEKELWADTFRELMSVENPSPELKSVKQSIIAMFCHL
jgi:hypothetical protein